MSSNFQIYSSVVKMTRSHSSHRIYPHIHKGRFYNYAGEKKPSFLIPSIGMMLEWYLSHEGSTLDVSAWLDPVEPLHKSMIPAITWIGHSTFLIQIGSVNILTDPVFGNLSPLFCRILPPGITLDKLPPIDFVLISHNHRDHMDAATLNVLKQHENSVFLIPQGDKYWFEKRGFNRVREHMWWEKYICKFFIDSMPVEFTFLPAFHWSQRGIFDYNKSLWGSWMISHNDINIYFAGDTAYSQHFKSIAYEFSSIDIALMPIGPCEPRQWMKSSHVSAEEAGLGFLDLQARHFIPMHWGTYYFGTDKFDIPHMRLLSWWNTHMTHRPERLHSFKVGQRMIFEPQTLIIPQSYQSQVVL